MTEQAHTTFAKDQLKSIIERVERLEADKAEIAADIRDVYAEAKGNGFTVSAIRTIVKMRKQDADERREAEAVLDLYLHALGMLSDLPLGQAAIERARAKATPPKRAQAAVLAEAATITAESGPISGAGSAREDEPESLPAQEFVAPSAPETIPDTVTVAADGRTFEIPASDLGAVVKGILGRQLGIEEDASPTAAADPDLDIPDKFRRGHPDCIVQGKSPSRAPP